jgi:hypothetical protein
LDILGDGVDDGGDGGVAMKMLVYVWLKVFFSFNEQESRI